MKRIRSYFICVLSLTAVLAGTSSAQVATGVPPFSSIGEGPFDQINLGNLNVHFSIPIVNKAGRGMPFTYNVTYDNSVWTPGGATGHQGWQLSTTGGWQGLTQITSANVTYSTTFTSGRCGMQGQYTWQSWQYSNFVYEDASGAEHPIPYGASYITSTGTTSQNCPPTGPNPATAFPVPTTDGSGYSMIAIPGQGSVSTSIGSSNGATLTAGSIEDANGNEITNNGSVYTDTLGQTALTVTGLATPASPIVLTYTGPSGSRQYTANYTATNVLTNFGCSGVSEFSGTVNLVSSINLPDGSSYSFTYETNGTNYTGRLKQVTLPTGGTITYSYTGLNGGISCIDGSTIGLTRTLSPGGTWTYTRSYTGSNNIWTTTVVDPSTPSNTTVINFAKDNATSNSTNNFYETQRQVYQGSTSGTLLTTTNHCWNSTALSCPSTAVSSPISTTLADTTLANGSTNEVYTTYNSNGLITEQKAYDWGRTLVSDISIVYATTLGSIVDHPTNISIKNAGGTVVAATSYAYDENAISSTSGTPQHVNISGARGNTTTVSRFIRPAATLTKHFTYYDTGTMNTSTDVNGAVTTNVYSAGSCGNSFPTQVNMPLSLSTLATWNCVGGVQLTSTDANGNTTTTTYSDPNYWRPATTTDPATNLLHYNYYNPAPTARVETFMFFNSNQSIAEQLTTLDGFGRTSVVQRQQAPGVTNFDTVETDYDVVGRVYKTYLPYFSTSYGQTNPGGPGTTQTYDALNRPLVTTDGGGGTVTNSYTNNDVLQTVGPAPSGENTKRKQFEYDGLGRLTSVCEITSGPGSGTCGQTTAQTGYWTKYTYDAMGDLTQVTQNAQSSSPQTRTYTYDEIGRVTSETNPESGATAYSYDTATGTSCSLNSPGDMIKKVDANGNWVCYNYDSLHRLTDVGNSIQNTSNPCKRFRYDNSSGVLGVRPTGVSVSNSMGQIVEAETDNCASWPITQSSIVTDEWFSYGALGNNTDVYQSTPTSSGYYHSQASFYPNGAINTLTPVVAGSPTFTYGADGEGRTSTVANSSGQNPVPSPGASYNLASQVTGLPFGSGDSDSYQYDPNTGRMNQYQFKMGSLTDTGVLGWNANSSLRSLAITDQINSTNTQTCSYIHDDLSRVASVNCPSAWSQGFTYDAYGNITKSGSSAWMPGYNNNNRYTLGGTSYDADGNLLNDTVHTYAWDVYGNPITMDGVLNLTYDASGRMVQYSNSSTNASMLMGPLGNKPLAVMNGQTIGEYFIPLPGGAMMRSNWGYRHGDWLGSVRLQTSFTQTLVSDSAYAPFGENYAAAGPHGDVAFTQGSTDSIGQLLSTSLYDFPFRKLAQAQGRWISPDPAGMAAADPTNPQSWNRYAYVLNNPLGMTDPTGLDPYSPYPIGIQGTGLLMPERPFGIGGGGSGDTCYLDSVETDCGFVESALDSGAAVVCPYGCSAIGSDGRPVYFFASVNGPGGYYNYSGPGSLYYSEKQAGIAAVTEYEQQSIDVNREFGGVVYGDANGVFSYSQPVEGPVCGTSEASCEVNYETDIPNVLASYHTHPDVPGADNFSTTDIEDDTGNNISGFVGTPGGRVLIFDFNLLQQFGTIGGISPVCVLQGPPLGLRMCN